MICINSFERKIREQHHLPGLGLAFWGWGDPVFTTVGAVYPRLYSTINIL